MTVDKPTRNQAIEFHNRALQTVQADPTTAYRLLCSAVTIDPSFAQGWYMMGNTTADLKMLPASIASFKRALELPVTDESGGLTPDLRAKCLVNLSHRLMQDGRFDEACEWSGGALDYLLINPHLDAEGRAFAWTNAAMLCLIEGDLGAALANARKGYEYSQAAGGGEAAPIVEMGLAFAQLFNGHYAEGLRHFEARFPYRLPAYLNFPYGRWDGQRLPDGSVFIAADQGLGDTLSFARFIPAVAERVGRVVFQVQPELLRLLTAGMRSWPNVEVIPQGPQFPVADVWCPIFSLPLALDMKTSQIRKAPQVWEVPDLPSPMEPGWKARGRKLHIGIAYAGSPLNDIDRWRSVPVTDFLALYDVPGVQLYSLQVGDRVRDLHDAGMASLVCDLSPWIRDAADTVGIVRELDLVITIESFIGHLCGAAGVPCWVLSSARGGDWRVGKHGETTLWYGNTRVFRQGPDMAWGPVWTAVVEALRALSAAARERA